MSEDIEIRIKENWLTQKPHKDAIYLTAGFALLLFFGALLYFTSGFEAREWMPASRAAVFERFELWRLFTTLLAHGDFGHLAANSFLFIPLTFLLSAHFGPFLFPLLAFVFGALVNLVVLSTMPEETRLIGISGVTSWMGSAWLTLSLLIDRRHKLRRRIGAALFLTIMLFVPETIKPEVSYFSHFTGYALGAMSGLAYYFFKAKTFSQAEVFEIRYPEELHFGAGLQEEEGAAANSSQL